MLPVWRDQRHDDCERDRVTPLNFNTFNTFNTINTTNHHMACVRRFAG